jgi:DNA-binding NtrC family response regulator
MTMDKTKVLIVDDENDFATALSDRMASRGLAVDTAATGEEALHKVEEGAYDAIVLDLVMPGMDGIETLKRLLEKRPELQVILLTGHASLEKGIESVKLGALDFLEKPADFSKLLQRIEHAKANRLLLVEKKFEDIIQEVLKKKGW